MACKAFAGLFRRESSASTDTPSCQLETEETFLFESEGSAFGGSDASCDVAPLPASQELLDAAFSVDEIQSWEHANMRMERVLHAATASRGRVDHMIDAATGEHVAVKRKPNDWICDGREDFARRHPGAAEQPWTDLCCTAFLTSVEFPYVCPLRKVYRSERFTHVVTELATHGDLFQWSTACKEEPGPAREGEHVAVKRKPNDWICDGREDFAQRHPGAAEQPWMDLCCTAFLTSVEFPYVCPLRMVYRSEGFTHVVTELATHGDLFQWSTACKEEPGPAREALVLPLAVQVMDAVRRLHDLSLVHGNICAENFLLSRRAGEDELHVELIDFGRSSTERFSRGGAEGKPSYRAPEMHSGGVFDRVLADGFALGVVLYSMLVQEYPWRSTRPGACKAFDFFQRHGFRAFAARRKCFNRSQTVAQCMSEPVMQVLEGLLCANPSERSTLGDSEGLDSIAHTSIWQMAWLHAHPLDRKKRAQGWSRKLPRLTRLRTGQALLASAFACASASACTCCASSCLPTRGAFAARRKCFNRSQTVAQCMSEPVMQVLEGLLCANPSERFTLGDSEGLDSIPHISIWQMAWLHAHPLDR
eukprot:CAMPEP_0204610576 /NCGR_PEP_ID=MMETSP0661-20131031/61577_1 /ASSEMBLY_ACC=CAM_ASM_000606 /TAXON_ID=109239 /ORGANISM="Alexandrium margalefi, Strain AMGDE01CS-322" /LENGTH=590 /DNA_ID=CAMNT_0051622393 /DNA_START=71 /DNA_END=1844 /DNA_ORIENTATION=-